MYELKRAQDFGLELLCMLTVREVSKIKVGTWSPKSA